MMKNNEYRVKFKNGVIRTVYAFNEEDALILAQAIQIRAAMSREYDSIEEVK